MKLKEVLDRTITFFRDKKIETPRLDAELLMSHGLGIERIQLYLKFDQPLAEAEMVPLRELVRRRALGEPVAYILGYKDFYKSRFKVTPAVLIPRPETEHIVEDVVEWLEQQKKKQSSDGEKNSDILVTPRASDLADIEKSEAKIENIGIIDLGAGSGCLGLSLLVEIPNAKLISVDLSTEALNIAMQNAETLGLSDRVVFLNTSADNVDLVLKEYRNFIGKDQVDILVSNPPYIENNDPLVETNVHKFEPHMALYAPDRGYQLLKSWSKLYSPHLSSKSLMLMEIGSTQGKEMEDFYKNLNVFKTVSIRKDLSGLDRIVRGEKNG